MARRTTVEVETSDQHDEVVAYYRRRLAEPAVLPWAGTDWPPVTIGPTWQTTKGGHWLLPDASVGWDVLGWCGTELQHEPGKPWVFTDEQARFILHWYAVDEHGVWVDRDGVLQRLKGWGKDPVGGTLLYTEALGPCRVAYMDGDRPVATDCPTAWVQTAATSLEQTKNTMRLMPGLITPEARAHYGVQPGKELIHALDGERLIQAVTSSPSTLEGARATFVLKNETHHWLANNSGQEMAAVIDRNATKSADGAARTLAITNAFEPSEESVAQHDREAWETAAAGESLTTGILYDSLEAAADAPLTAEAAPAVVTAIRGDSVWLDVKRIVAAILDTRNPPSRSRRFWYNQITATEDAWVLPQVFDTWARPDWATTDDDEFSLFFDGSKSDDATGLVACRISDGHVLTVGMWQRPPGGRGDDWLAPRPIIDDRVAEFMESRQVLGFFADPSHTTDDETGERYWDALIDEWHRRWKDQLGVWAVPGKGGHAVMWDMTSPARSSDFTAAAERTVSDIDAGDLTWDGDGRLRIHVHNARRYPNRYGVSLWKGHRESKRKVDLAVCMVGARMVRRLVLNNPNEKKARSGVIW